MKWFLTFITIMSCALYTIAQNQFNYNATEFKSALGGSFKLTEIEELPDAKIITVKPLPSQLTGTTLLKHQLTLKHAQTIGSNNKNTLAKKAANTPQVARSFMANVSQGTPNDNDFAISNGNIIASCVNTNINFYNDTGKFVFGRTLSSIANKLGALNRTYDPRVIYDPVADKFILVFLQGSSSVDTRIIIGFSTTNDPSKPWNFYQLPGNITGDSSWSDYPIISINNEDLFITVNRLKDNTFWKNGFIESYIWQVNKANGYNGDSLAQKVYNNITHNGKAIWSICPAKNSFSFADNSMFFLSVRPDQLANDTVFMHYIDNSLSSGNSKLTTKILKTPMQYGLQPNAIMPNGKYLQTNDARILSAMNVNGMLYFVSNCVDTNLYVPGIMFGIIEETWTNTPKVHAQIISYDSMDIGYPSIAYAGTGQNGDHSAMITFSHVSKTYFPGTSVLYVDRNFNISAPVFVKKGDGNIQLISDSVQRWGDYTGIQTKYNAVGECWLSGSFGTATGGNSSWVGRVLSTDPLTGLAQNKNKNTEIKVYPNPTTDILNVLFSVNQKTLVTVQIGSLDGKILKNVLVDFAKPGDNELHLTTNNLPAGMYFVNLITNENIIKTHKFVVNR